MDNDNLNATGAVTSELTSQTDLTLQLFNALLGSWLISESVLSNTSGRGAATRVSIVGLAFPVVGVVHSSPYSITLPLSLHPLACR